MSADNQDGIHPDFSDPSKVINLTEAARELGVTKQTVETRAQRKGFSSSKQGKYRLYLREEVLGYRGEGRSKPKAQQ